METVFDTLVSYGTVADIMYHGTDVERRRLKERDIVGKNEGHEWHYTAVAVEISTKGNTRKVGNFPLGRQKMNNLLDKHAGDIDLALKEFDQHPTGHIFGESIVEVIDPTWQ